jgi:site-specific recombinase XerD
VVEIQKTSSQRRQVFSSDPSSIIESLKPQVEHILSAAVAKNTAVTYQRALDSFALFRNKYALPLLWPPPVHQFVNYIAYLSANSVSYSTARSYLSGISYHLQIQGEHDHTKTFIVKKMLEGLHKLNPAKDVRAPFTLPMLNQFTNVLSSVCSNLYEATLFATAFQLAFFAQLRVSELTVASNQSTVLSIHDVHITDSQIELFLKGSKTDQFGKGASIQIPFNHETSPLFTHIQQYLAMRPPVQGPFCCHLDGKPLTSYQFSAILHKSIKFIGIDTSTYKSHSFRIGGATHLLQGFLKQTLCTKVDGNPMQ